MQMFWVIIEDVYFATRSIHTKHSGVMVYVKRNSSSHAKTNRFTYKGPGHNSGTTKGTIVKFYLYLMECSNNVVELFVKSNSNFNFFFYFQIFKSSFWNEIKQYIHNRTMHVLCRTQCSVNRRNM